MEQLMMEGGGGINDDDEDKNETIFAVFKLFAPFYVHYDTVRNSDLNGSDSKQITTRKQKKCCLFNCGDKEEK